MTLKSVCDTVLAETGWPALSGIASNGDATARQLFSLANSELQSLAQDRDWPMLMVEYEIPLVYGVSLYAMPTDCRTLVQNTAYYASQYQSVRGSVGSREWNYRKYGLLSSLDQLTFRIRHDDTGASIEFASIPSPAQPVVIEYFTKNYARDAGNAPKLTYELDTDTARIPERLIELGLKWRFRRAKGLDFSVELAEYNSTVAAQYARTIAQADIPIGGYRNTGPLTCGYVPDSGFGA